MACWSPKQPRATWPFLIACTPSLTAKRPRIQVPSRFNRDGTCSFLLGIICPGYCHHSIDYCATTASAPISGNPGRAAGVAYVTLKLHVLPTASGVVKEQVFADTEYKLPVLSRRFSAVIRKGPVPLLVTVTTLVTGVRAVGIVNVRVRTPSMVVSVPLVAEVTLNVPCPPAPPPPPPPPPPVVAANSTAPMSTAFGLAGSGLAWPKKSVLGAAAKAPPEAPRGTPSMAGEPATSV